MKELSKYYITEKITQAFHKTEAGHKGVRNKLQDNENIGVAELARLMTPKVTPFNYAPYVRRPSSAAFGYEAMLSDKVRIPNAIYSK